MKARPRWTIGVVALALLLITGGVAYATIPDSNGVIHGCYATKNGSLRVIDPSAGQSCGTKEAALDWNAQGPQGSTGPAGPAGPAGSTHGYETNTQSSIPGSMALFKPISISGLPDGNYLVSAQLNVFGIPGDIIYCGLMVGANYIGYTVESELSPNQGSADPVLVSAVSLSGGSSTVSVQCEDSGTGAIAYSALSLNQVAALN